AEGIFPQETGGGAPYSIISFMDVLEHLPNPEAALQSAKQLLTEEGLLVIQVPDQACLLYAAAKAMNQLAGKDFALRRLWLTEFAFPHQFYFNRVSLTKLLERSGFVVTEFFRAAISDPREDFS